MDEPVSQKPEPAKKGYGKHSKSYWVMVYVVVAILVYGLVYMLFIHKGTSTGGGLNY